jgi:IS5 family transposase
MFKALLLQSWHSLSDAKLEEALSVRIDFMLFTGIGIEQDVPEETTICRFRNRLVSKGLDKELFREVNRQLEMRGLKIEKTTGAVIDATVIESAARPKRCIDVALDRNEEEPITQVNTESSEDNSAADPEDPTEAKPEEIEIKESVDPDAKWLKKGKRSYFGYKLFLATDEKDGYATGVDVTSANKSETKHFSEFIEKVPTNKGTRIYGDKAYASRENRTILRDKKLKDGLMEKAVRGRALSARQKLKNRLISKRRHIVEQGYGTMKRILKFNRASYMGIAKVRAEAFRKAICFNLLKAVNRVKVDDWVPQEWCIQLQLM